MARSSLRTNRGDKGTTVGKNNKARRAAKAKQRARRGTPRSRGEQETHSWFDELWSPTLPQQIAAAWLDLLMAVRKERVDAPDLADRLTAYPYSLVDEHAESILIDILDALWVGGWQPAEVRRHARRKCSAVSTRLVELAIHADHDRRSGQRIDPRWAAQLREVAQREVSTRGSWLETWRGREGLTRAESYLWVASALGVLSRLPVLDVLIPPPGADESVVEVGIPANSGVAADPVLGRIRKLLAKAESTEFDDEATALTAKAQELMTRHAIDHATLDAVDDRDVPRMIRLPVDAPYADAKSMLLQVVAEANRCRAVFLDRLELSSVAGHASDLSVVEMMFTSLLVQAQNSLNEAARADNMGRRGRSQSFRSSFFIAYAHRIGERLRGVNEQVTAETGSSGALPVLRAREDAVVDFMNERYGDSTYASSVRGGYDYAGQALGRRAADDAKLSSGELLW